MGTKIKYIFLLLVSACNADPCPSLHYDWGFEYTVLPDTVTKYGVKVDTTGQNLGPEVFDMIDTMTKDVELCLKKNFPDGDLSSIKVDGFCYPDKFDYKCDKDCLEVKIPDDWHWSSIDNINQLLSDKAPEEGCNKKGLDPIEECYWRAGLQDGYKVIITPNLYLYKDPLIKYITGCDSVWPVPKLAECASPNILPDWNK